MGYKSIASVNVPYFIMIFIIGVISAYDNTLSYLYSDVLKDTEQNPIGKLIINNYGVSSFITIKMITTLMCVVIMFGLMKTKYNTSIKYVFLFQLLLFYYITFTTPSSLVDRGGFSVIQEAIDLFYEYWGL